MNVKLSPELERRVTEHVARQHRYASPEAFVERAIEVFLGEETEVEHLEALLLEGLGTPTAEFSEKDWEEIRTQGQHQYDQRKVLKQP